MSTREVYDRPDAAERLERSGYGAPANSRNGDLGAATDPLVGVQGVVGLSDEAVGHFLPGGANLNPDAMLRTAAEAASRDAEEWEHEAEESEKRAAAQHSEGNRRLDKEHAADYQNGAQVDRQVAQHALSLLGKLKPYLVRGVVLNEGSRARFVVYLVGTELWIEHPLLPTDLSHRLPMKRHPVVIFLERAPAQVHVLMDVSEPEWYAAKNPAQ